MLLLLAGRACRGDSRGAAGAEVRAGGAAGQRRAPDARHGEPVRADRRERCCFGNDEVALRGPWDRDEHRQGRARPPTTSRRGSSDYHLDFPGDALKPGCTYEEWSAAAEREGAADDLRAGRRPRPRIPGKLALQYWFFYVFNDFNNLHEGDWEMIQLNFDARDAGAGADAAADRGRLQPARGRGARALGRLASSRRSTARIRSSTRRPARTRTSTRRRCSSDAAPRRASAATTPRAVEQLLPTVAVVPTATAAYLRAYPWLGVRGPLGRAAAGVLQRPHRPEHEAPVDGADHVGRRAGGTAASPSRAARRSARARRTSSAAPSPPARMCSRRSCATRCPGALTVAAVFALLLLAASRTSWRGSAPLRLARRRAWGELITSARQMYRRRFRLFAGIGAALHPVRHRRPGSCSTCSSASSAFVPLVQTAGETNVSVAGLAFSLGTDLHRRRARVRPGRDRVRDGRGRRGAST